MTIPLIATFSQTIFMLLLGGMAIFLILLVLVQRGRGGGLAGALGGMGGSSAFGAKAGDVFTRITIGAATIWIVLCIAAAKLTPSNESRIDVEANLPAATSPALTTAAEDEGEATSEGEAQSDGAAETSEPSSETAAEPSPDAEPASDSAAASDEEAQ